MKHKFLTVFLTLAAVLCLCFGLAGCKLGGSSSGSGSSSGDSGTTPPDHTHTYDVDNRCTECGNELEYTKTGLVYTLNDDQETCSVSWDNRTALKNVVIPYGYEGRFVTSIGDSAFKNCSLTSVTIPDSVTSIGDSAFSDCLSLKNIKIPDGVISIGESAFWNCSSLTSVEIPDGVTSIGDRAFEQCSSLTSIEIPDSVTSIGDNAFYYCISLKSIEIPDGVTSIGTCAFYYCNALESLTFGTNSKLTSIGEGAFEVCYSLENVTIPDSVTSIGARAFDRTAYYNDPSHWDSSGVLYIDNHLIKAEDTITSDYSIRANTKTIADGAFEERNSLKSIEIPDSVTSIGAYAFCNIGSLESVTFGTNSKLTSIGEAAFSYCRSLTSIEIPDGVTSIGGAVFTGCRVLASIEVAQGNPVYHSEGNCVIKTESKTLIAGCSKSKIPEGVTSIGSCAFEEFELLTSIEIPDSVTEIGVSAFRNCDSLRSIHFQGNVDQWNLIAKGSGWDIGTGDYMITCTDGTIDKEGNVTRN